MVELEALGPMRSQQQKPTLCSAQVLRPFGQPFQRVGDGDGLGTEFAGQVRDAFGDQVGPLGRPLLVEDVENILDCQHGGWPLPQASRQGLHLAQSPNAGQLFVGHLDRQAQLFGIGPHRPKPPQQTLAELLGDIEHWQHDAFIVRWRDRSLNADAFVNFALDADGNIREMRMEPVSPLTDFSFDFQDLRLAPVAVEKK